MGGGLEGSGVLNQRAVPGCDVMSVLSKTCSDISASCFDISLEHFRHCRKRKKREWMKQWAKHLEN